MLKSCGPDAILFMDGDIVVNCLRYLQIVEGYRPDVTALCTMGRARLTLQYKYGVRGAIRPAPISWSREQILDMQTYMWGTDTVDIPVPPEVLSALGMNVPDTVLRWVVEQASPQRTALSAYMAQVIDIVETNRWRRPIYLSAPMRVGYIDSCLQNCGLVYRLLPVSAAKYGLDLDTLTMTRVLLDSASYRDLAAYKQHPMPRVSGVLYNYFNCLLTLATHYNRSGNTSDYDAVVDRMAALGPAFYESVDPNYPARIEWLRKGMPPMEDKPQPEP